MRGRCYRKSVKVNPFPTLYFFYKIQMIVSENNDFNIVAALCSPVFSLLDVQISINDNKGHTKRRWSACVPACIAGAGFVVAQEEISR